MSHPAVASTETTIINRDFPSGKFKQKLENEMPITFVNWQLIASGHELDAIALLEQFPIIKVHINQFLVL